MLPSLFTVRFHNLCANHLLLAALMVLTLVTQSSAATETVKTSLLQRLQLASAQVDSFEASFVQEKELSLFAETMIFHGHLVVVRPDQLRWEFTDPVPSVLLLSGDAGLRCSGETKPVQFDVKTDPVMKSVAEQLWLWLGGDYSRLDDTFALQEKGENSLTVTPRQASMAEYIEQVNITFDTVNMQPEQVVIKEPGGDQTRLIFSNYRFNPPVHDDMFTRCTPQADNVN